MRIECSCGLIENGNTTNKWLFFAFFFCHPNVSVCMRLCLGVVLLLLSLLRVFCFVCLKNDLK